MYRFIINKRYVDLLKKIAVNGKHDILEISRDTGITYSRVSNIIMQFAKEGIVQKERTDEGPGRKMNVSITENGRIIIESFNKIDEIMTNGNVDKQIMDERGWKNGKDRK